MLRYPFTPLRLILLLFAFLLSAFLCLLTVSRSYAQEASPVNSQYDQAYLALTTANVYVQPGISGIDTQVLEQAASQGQDNPHTPVKIAILSSLPAAYLGNVRHAEAQDPQLRAQVGRNIRAYYAFELHHALGLDKEPLVLVVLQGQDPGVSVWTTALDASARGELEKQYAQATKTNPQDGTAQLAQAAASRINSKEYGGPSMVLWIVFLFVVIGLAALIVSAGRKKKQALTVSRGPIDALRENVLRGIEYLDGYIDVLPKNNPDSDQTRAFRQAASAKYEQAAKILDRATEMTDLQRGQTLLDQAQADVQSARRCLDRATGGTGNIPGDDALRPPPLPRSQAQVDAIPQPQRGVSFFGGRPAPLSSLVPVTITLGGQSRQVLVTPDEADELRRGGMPQVLAFQSGGRSLPWYAYDSYDPYRDYWRYENAGWGGYGNGLVAGFVGAELLDGMLMPSYGMGGYAPYAYATDMPGYANQGYDNSGYGAQGYGDPGFAGTGADSGGFTDNSNGNFDTQGFDPSAQGSGDFSTDNSGGSDSGGSDFGGSGDFGGGGGDSGGF